jgi:hypothetical protein
VSTDTNVDAIFDLAADATTSTPNTENTAEATTTSESNAESTENAEGTALYPNVLRRYKASEIANGENPEGTLTVAEFAGKLTVENILAGKGVEGLVKDTNIYTAIKAKRSPLPVVLVLPDDSDNDRDAKVYLPEAEAREAYENRPERGTGNGSASKRSYDELLEDAAKKFLALQAIETRLKRAQDQYGKANAQLEKYKGWLRPTHKDDENPDESVVNAITAKAEELEEAADAAKGSIDDAGNAVDTDEAQNA